jgi:hypothetical protein
MGSSQADPQTESPDGRAKYAAAVTQGIVTYLNAKAPASNDLSCCRSGRRHNEILDRMWGRG